MAFYSDLNYIKPEKGPILEDLAAIYQAVYTDTPAKEVFMNLMNRKLKEEEKYV